MAVEQAMKSVCYILLLKKLKEDPVCGSAG